MSRMTLSEAGTAAIAARALDRAYEGLHLGRIAIPISGDPFPALIGYYAPRHAKTLAAFWECCHLHGEHVARERYSGMYERHRRDTEKAGLTLHFGRKRKQRGGAEIVALPRPTESLLALRRAA